MADLSVLGFTATRRVLLLAVAVWAAATLAAVPPAVAQTGSSAFVAGSQPWTASQCDSSDAAVVAASDAAAQSDLYSAVTLAGILGTDCVVLAGDRGDPRLPAAQQARLDAAGFYIYVVGGESAVPDVKLAGYDIAVRIAGTDRWRTAARVGAAAALIAEDGWYRALLPDLATAVPEAGWPAPPWRTDCTAKPAVVAASDAAAQSDLYSAVTLAGALGTDCVVLAGNRSDTGLPAAQKARLDTAAAVFVVGGLKAVPAAKLAGKDIAARIAGADRWHTAADVGDRAGSLIATAARSSVRIAPPATTATGRTPEERVTHIQDWFAQIGLGEPVPVTFSSGACGGFAAACAVGDTIHYTDSPAQLQGDLLAHEYTHVYQHATDNLHNFPEWVVEGFAEYIAHKYSPGDARGERELCGNPLGENNDLSRMGPGQFSQSVYRAGELAFTELADQHGWAAITDYWTTPGTHQQRFQTAFGTTPERFERDFHQNACRTPFVLSLGYNDVTLPVHVGIFNPTVDWDGHASYPIDAIRLTPTIVWDTFEIGYREPPNTPRTVRTIPANNGAVVAGSAAAAEALKACGYRRLRIEIKIFGEWHPTVIALPGGRLEDYGDKVYDPEVCFTD
ncbi:hypothetical protein [Candidatus Poriferisodalis sp.]|uniref:hypothetical protein n=1 Tax=Candidatus Poriferisodalis sp. TaxID=3101277 RepID=UPI003B518277